MSGNTFALTPFGCCVAVNVKLRPTKVTSSEGVIGKHERVTVPTEPAHLHTCRPSTEEINVFNRTAVTPHTT